MSLLISSVLLFAAAAQAAGTDAPAACREAHEGDTPAHIACLERALRTRDEATREVDDFGAEQVRAQEGSPEAEPRRAVVEIVSTTYDPTGRGTFRLANGQIWRETEVAPAYLRLESDRRYTARIEKTRVFGYRMYVDGLRRMIKLERVK